MKDLLLLMRNKEKYKREIFNRYHNALNSFDDLLGDGYKEMSGLFYTVNRHFLYWLDNDPKVSVKKRDILFRRRFYPVLKAAARVMLGCKQVIENRDYIDDPVHGNAGKPKKMQLSDRPVIFVANHGFRDDALATVIAANRHAYIYWGSLPLFFNTFDGLASSLVGEVMVNRKKSESKKASIQKALRVMKYGTDLIIFPEGGWNKTSERLVLNLWHGVYRLSSIGKYDVVPIVHYVRDPEIISKKNIIHTIVDEPIPLYQMPEEEALAFLRDKLASWQYKMIEIYGQSTRSEELEGYRSGTEKWSAHLIKRMSYVRRYDAAVEKNAEYRPKNEVRPEDVFRTIAYVKNISAENVKMVLEADKIVTEREKADFQRLF